MKTIFYLPLLTALAVGLGMAFHLEFEAAPNAEFTAEKQVARDVQIIDDSDLLQGFEEIEAEAHVAAAEPARPTAPVRPAAVEKRESRGVESETSSEIEEARRVLVSTAASRAARRRALDVLGTSSDPRAAEVLLEAFAHIEDEGLRQEALLRLESLEDVAVGALLALGASVEDDPAASERLADVVADRLRRSGETDPVQILTSPGAPAGHSLVESVLRRLDSRARVAEAQSGLSGDDSARLAALEILAGMDDSDALALLEQILLESGDADARSEALTALLEQSGDVDEQVLAHLVQHDESAEVRSVAAAAMVDAATAESLSLLVLALSSDPDASVRAAAADALASAAAASDPAPALLASLASDPTELVRAHAGRALAARFMLVGSIGDGATAQSVEDGLEALAQGSPSPDVRVVASAGIEIIRRVRETS